MKEVHIVFLGTFLIKTPSMILFKIEKRFHINVSKEHKCLILKYVIQLMFFFFLIIFFINKIKIKEKKITSKTFEFKSTKLYTNCIQAAHIAFERTSFRQKAK